MDLSTTLNDAFSAYRHFSQANPVLSTMLTAEFSFLAGDSISQLAVDKKIDPKKLGYTAALAPLYGLGIYGLVQTGEFVGDHISDDPLAKSALGPNNIHGILYNTFFFVNNTVGEKNNYSLKKLVGHYASIFTGGVKGFFKRFKEKYVSNIPRKEFACSALAVLTAWNGIQYVSYSYAAEEMRTPFVLGANLIWTGALSLWSLNGRRRIASENIEDKL